MNIFDEKKTLPFYFMRQPNPERGLFMDIQKKIIYEHLWLH